MKKRIIIAVIVAAAIIALVFQLNTYKKPTTDTTKSLPLYIAMGDSIAAGAGLETSSDSSACDRNNESYPNIIATNLKLNLLSLSCSGATTTQGLIEAQTVNKLLLKPQLEEAFSQQTPKYITITIGANDIDWTSILLRCVVDICGTKDDDKIIDTKLEKLTTNIKTILDQIESRYKPATPKVVMTGYYEIFPISAKPCPAVAGIDNNEQQWWNAAGTKLNQTIVAAGAQYNFVDFALPSFIGHDLCSDNAWVQNTNGTSPFHPNDDGQKAIAKSVIAKLKR